MPQFKDWQTIWWQFKIAAQLHLSSIDLAKISHSNSYQALCDTIQLICTLAVTPFPIPIPSHLDQDFRLAPGRPDGAESLIQAILSRELFERESSASQPDQVACGVLSLLVRLAYVARSVRTLHAAWRKRARRNFVKKKKRYKEQESQQSTWAVKLKNEKKENIHKYMHELINYTRYVRASHIESHHRASNVRMRAVRITSWYPEFNGRHFGLPPNSIHRMTGWQNGVNDENAHRPDCTILGEFPMKPKHVHFQTPFGAVTQCLQWKWRRKGRMEERTEAWAQWAYTDPDELVRRSSDGDMLRPADTSTDAAIPLSRTSSITSSSSTTGQCSSSETQRNAFISHPSHKLHQSETKIEKIQDPLPAVSRRPVWIQVVL